MDITAEKCDNETCHASDKKLLGSLDKEVVVPIKLLWSALRKCFLQSLILHVVLIGVPSVKIIEAPGSPIKFHHVLMAYDNA